MSSGREKDQKDFDLEQIVKIMDAALESDDQRIKDALRALLTVTVLCTAEHPDKALNMGPLSRLIEDMHNINRRLGSLEDDFRQLQYSYSSRNNGGAGQPAMPYMPHVPVGPNVWHGTTPPNPTPMWGPSWTSAGDDLSYKVASSSSSAQLAEDFIKSLEEKH